MKKKVTHHLNKLTEKDKTCVRGREIKLKHVNDTVIHVTCQESKSQSVQNMMSKYILAEACLTMVWGMEQSIDVATEAAVK